MITALLRGKGIPLGTRDAKFLHAEIKRRPLDSQTGSGAIGTGDNPPGLLQSLAYVVSLRFFQCNCLLGRRGGGSLQARERGLQNIPRAEDDTALDEILQLANIPWPGVRCQFRHRFWGNLVDLCTYPAGIDLHKMFHQDWNVVATRTQGRQWDWKHVQAIVEVAAKFISPNHVDQVSVGGRHQPNVHVMRPSTAQALELLFLKNT